MKRNKIMATIGWASVLTSIPWIIGASVIVIKFNDQRQVINKSKLEKEQSKTKNKQLDTKIKKSDDKIKALELEKQISTKIINQLKDKNKQQEKVHKGWYVKNSQEEIAKLEKETKESKTRHDESVKKLEDDVKKLENEILILEASKSSIKGGGEGRNKSVKRLEDQILILEASKSSIKESHDKLKKSHDDLKKQYNTQWWKLKKQEGHFNIIWEIFPRNLWYEMYDFTFVKDTLDWVYSTTTKEITKSPSEVIYSSFDDFTTKINFTFNKEAKEKFKTPSMNIKVEVENGNDFQTVTLKINKKDKTIAESTIKVTGFKPKS